MEKLIILWLDDIRDPNKYFNKKQNSNTFFRNKTFYDNLFSKYDVEFIWVKNFNEFTNFILNNGLPKFISFDHDLGAGLKKGLDCAKWLVKYCQKTNSKIPMFYTHSANPNGIREINKLLNSLNEKKLSFENIVKKILRECQ